MSNPPLTMSRRHILGDLNGRCEPALDVPVYLDNSEGELIGHVDESHGRYADALTFHLEDGVCKKLAAGQFVYSLEYEFADASDASLPSGKRRIKLGSIVLKLRKGYEKPIPKNVSTSEPESVKVA
ncbi:MAG TPA: hypothetical protein VL572_04640 [Pyrinomonadaceae bacterium]|nr:hypothetical protein [Pyrinomonadaceae bacterium]